MKKRFSIPAVLFLMALSTLNFSSATEKVPGEATGDCSECMNSSEYLEYFRQAEAGSMVATYQAAAVLIGCYIQNGCFGSSTGYTYEELLNMYNQNMQTAEELGGEQPYIKLPDSPPDNDDNNNRNNNSNDGPGDGRIEVKSAK